MNVIGDDNGAGLTQDLTLLRRLLEGRGHRATLTHWEAAPRRADVNIFLELLYPAHLKHAPVNIGILNLERFSPAMEEHLLRFTQLWAKSREAHNFYQRRGLPSRYTGFASRDLRDPHMSKKREVLHLRGASKQKNTAAVFEAWRRHHARLPPLVVVSEEPLKAPACVRFIVGRRRDDVIRRLVNECRWHLCPSEAEGWGHAIAEALSCEGVVITTDASPMNEHVRPEFGTLIPARPISRGVVTGHLVDPEDLARAVMRTADLSDETLTLMGRRARAHWERRQAAFFKQASALFTRVEVGLLGRAATHRSLPCSS